MNSSRGRFRSARDPGQDEARDKVGIPALDALARTWADGRPVAMRQPRPADMDGGSYRVQQVQPDGSYWHTFTVRASRTNTATGTTAMDTELRKYQAWLQDPSHAGLVLLVGQCYLLRPWQHVVANAAVASMFDVVAACHGVDTNPSAWPRSGLRTSQMDRGGFVSSFYFIHWGDMEANGMKVTILHPPMAATEPPPCPEPETMHNLFGEDA